MSDLISRNALVEKMNDTNIEIMFDLPVEELLGEDVDMDDFCTLLQDAIQAYRKLVISEVINNAPTVEAKPVEWIPCSERLPMPIGNEEMVDVEVTIEGNGRNVRIPAFYFYKIRKFFPYKIGGTPLKNVIAWMPLLTPYNADMRGGENG